MDYNLTNIQRSEAYKTFEQLVTEQSGRGEKTLRASTNDRGVTKLYTTSKISMHGLFERINLAKAVERKNNLHTQGLSSLKELAKAAYPHLGDEVFSTIFKNKIGNGNFKAKDLNDLKKELDQAQEEFLRAKNLDQKVKDDAVKTQAHDLKKTVEYQNLVFQANQQVSQYIPDSEKEKINTQKTEAQAALKEFEEQAPTRAEQTKKLIEDFKKTSPNNMAQPLVFKKHMDLNIADGNPVGQLVESLKNCHEKEDAGERAITILSLAQAVEPGMTTLEGREGSNLLVSDHNEHTTAFWECNYSPGYQQKDTTLGKHFQDFTKKLSPNENNNPTHFGSYFTFICNKYPDEVKAAAIMTGKNNLIEKLLDNKNKTFKLDSYSRDIFNAIYKDQLQSIHKNDKGSEIKHSSFISELMWQIANNAKGISMPKDLNNV